LLSRFASQTHLSIRNRLTRCKVLILAHQEQERYPHVFRSTYSILFLGTPHGGSPAADQGAIISKIAALSFQNPAKQLLETLKHGSQELVRLSLEFRKLASNFDVVSFYERRKTLPLGSLVRQAPRSAGQMLIFSRLWTNIPRSLEFKTSAQYPSMLLTVKSVNSVDQFILFLPQC
jgi:hypothetical protein